MKSGIGKSVAVSMLSLIIAMTYFAPTLFGVQPQAVGVSSGTGRTTAITDEIQASCSGTPIGSNSTAGRIFPASTSSASLVNMPSVTFLTVSLKKPANLEVSLTVELATTAPNSTTRPAGLLASVDGVSMNPNVGPPGSGFLAGYVVQPPFGTFVGQFTALEHFTLTWTKCGVPAGFHVIRFLWAVQFTFSTLWGDFFNSNVVIF